jgi:hypothetical protein
MPSTQNHRVHPAPRDGVGARQAQELCLGALGTVTPYINWANNE